MPRSNSLKCKGHSKNTKNATLRGGRTAIVGGPKIKYEKGSKEYELKCTKCGKENFIVKTLTLGTKTKSMFGFEIFDNRFKVFTCTECGFVQLYSNKITCNGKQCDPLL